METIILWYIMAGTLWYRAIIRVTIRAVGLRVPRGAFLDASAVLALQWLRLFGVFGCRAIIHSMLPAS